MPSQDAGRSFDNAQRIDSRQNPPVKSIFVQSVKHQPRKLGQSVDPKNTGLMQNRRRDSSQNSKIYYADQLRGAFDQSYNDNHKIPVKNPNVYANGVRVTSSQKSNQ